MSHQQYYAYRIKFHPLDGPAFNALFEKWWPKRDAIMLAAATQGQYKGKTADEWDLWLEALIDEYSERQHSNATYLAAVQRIFNAVEVTERNGNGSQG